MYCTNCGKNIPDTSTFCKYCGAKVKKNEVINNNVNEKNTEISQNINDKKIKVIFKRKKKYAGCAVPMHIYIDGNKVATLKNGASSEVESVPGNHEIIVEFWGGVSKNNVNFSAQYSKMYIEVAIKMGLITGKAVITEIKGG